MIKLRHLSMEWKYSVLSMASLSGVLVLHLIHWLSMPLVMGAAAELQTHHHEMGGDSSLLLSTIMMVLFIVNLVSMYFAVRQLIAAILKPGKLSKHTMLCSSISFLVLCVGIYTMSSI